MRPINQHVTMVYLLTFDGKRLDAHLGTYGMNKGDRDADAVQHAVDKTKHDVENRKVGCIQLTGASLLLQGRSSAQYGARIDTYLIKRDRDQGEGASPTALSVWRDHGADLKLLATDMVPNQEAYEAEQARVSAELRQLEAEGVI